MKRYSWEISKVFNGLCYAHRVHCQDIRHALCCDGDTNACLRTHGHNGVAEITIGGNELQRGFVADFKELNFMKVVYDEMFDHRFVLDINDPIADKLAHGQFLLRGEAGSYKLKPVDDAKMIKISFQDRNHNTSNKGSCFEYSLRIVPFEVKGTDHIPFWRVEVPESMKTNHPDHVRTTFQHLEALSLVDYIPSSENFVRKMFELAQSVLEPYGIAVTKSSWKETEKSTAVYYGPVEE